ncbi:DUF5988 family protein [Actinoplanes sp. N902-109]|uniref:DUF5988 family protein n=1 Tax=Actinoplanes sp. (strain N902-109) TaxID=649831 RepID=UPI00032952C7|nr:DUF5988 family protein [Actinoplanes sp. N902-109]AGL15993.1 hypothetical protein L083_2483 [Actinoplanes sp. N902-109]
MEAIKVFLSGGPGHFPNDKRLQVVDSLEHNFKCQFESGYEHFQHGGEFVNLNGEDLPVLAWHTRTFIAE